jgi:hypothetical protein
LRGRVVVIVEVGSLVVARWDTHLLALLAKSVRERGLLFWSMLFLL